MKSIGMLVRMFVMMVITLSSISGYALGLNLTVRHFDTSGIVYTGNDLPPFYTERTSAPQVYFAEIGKETILTSSGLEHDSYVDYLPFYQYSVDIPNLFFPTLTNVRVNESLCYFRYYGDMYLKNFASRSVREVIVTLNFSGGGYYNANTAPSGLPIMSLALQLEEKSIGKINFPLYIPLGTKSIKYRVVVKFDGSYSITQFGATQ